MKTIRIPINSYDSRVDIIVALATMGRKVWIEEEMHFSETIYLVCFNVAEGEIYDE